MHEFEGQDLLPTEVLAKHLGPDTSGYEASFPRPAAEAESPEPDSEDTPEDPDADEAEDTPSGPEEEDTDTDEDEAGDEEPEEGEEEAEDEVEETSEEREDDDFLPPFDRKEIEKHPELRKAYKHMRAAFTRKMQELGEKARRADFLEREFMEFQARLRDDKGAEEFLVQVALARPEVFERAYERAVRLAENEEERNLFIREQQLRHKEREAELRRMEMEAQRIQARAQEITATITRLGKAAGLVGDDLELVERLVVAKINENRAKTGKADVTDEEIQEAVDTARRLLQRREGTLAKKLQKERDAKVKALAAKAKEKRPAPPRATKSPGVKPKKIGPPPPGVDPLDHALDSLLGLHEA